MTESPRRQLTVDIAALEVSTEPEDVLVTYALGSCIAVLLHDSGRRIGGMIHYMLPLSRTNPDKARARPAMFADTGVPLLFEQMYRAGSRKADLSVRVVGGAQIYDDNGTFEIGRKNYLVLRKLFWKNGVLITAEDVGGAGSRTARLHVGSGAVTIRTAAGEHAL